MDFGQLGLSEKIGAGLQKQKITVPTPVQAAGVPVLLRGEHAYVCAPTGTGKTLAYLLPLFAQIDPSVEGLQAIVLAPTHELAIQIQRQVNDLVQNAGIPLRSALLIGGSPVKRQIEKLKKKPHIAIGSTGRILDLVEMKKLKVPALKTLVVDEADRLLFAESLTFVESLISKIPGETQMVFVSATRQAESSETAERLAPSLSWISTDGDRVNDDIAHLYFSCEIRKKADLLRKLLRCIDPERAIVFTHRNADAELLFEKLRHYKLPAVCIHGEQGKLIRKKAMDAIRKGSSNILISSDVAARGLDIKGVTHVFNYDAPSKSKDYLHRAGRTGRAGEEGYALSLISREEAPLVRRYEKDLGIEMQHACIEEGEIYAVDEE